MIVLDSGAVSWLASRDRRAVAVLEAVRARGLWPPIVPTAVLVECLTGHAGRDARVNRLLKTVLVDEELAISRARRAAFLRRRAGRGSAVDSIVVTLAEPGGTVLTGDVVDLGALAAHADDVTLEHV